MTVGAGPLALTDEQRDVVGRGVDEMLLITAGPGTGKTTTLVHRIAHLVGERGVPAADVLVLTFSRAAVATLRKRLGSLDEDAARVRVRTFDSWALEILTETGPTEEHVGGTFDRRIVRAGDALEQGRYDEQLEDLAHVVVDEVQDLVGIRRRLVTTLLEGFDCGFTVVGDLAQSIYGFQLARGSDETGLFVEQLRDHFRGRLHERSLTTNFRARTDDARAALTLGDELRSAPAGGGPNLLRDLREALDALDPLGEVSDPLALELLGDRSGTTAVLCQDNGEALLVSEALADADVRHRLRRSATDRAAPAWLAALFHEHRAGTLTRDAFDGLAIRIGIDRPPPDAWRLLLRCAGDRGGRVVDMGRLRTAIADGQLPDDLVVEDDDALLVSSIHRTKGLEFDRVVVVTPGRREDEDPREAARLLFVALTRARDEMWRLDPVRPWTVTVDRPTGRWTRCGRERWQRFGMEARGGDVLPDLSVGRVDPGAESSQDRAVDDLRIGDAVSLHRLDAIVPIGQAPEYVVVQGDRPVGRASEAFRCDLLRLLGGRARRFPASMHGLRVDAVETVVSAPAATLEAGLNDYGVRRVPRLVGLSRFDWGERDA